jgi:hypothetical protein
VAGPAPGALVITGIRYREHVTIPETLGIFAGIPAGVVALVSLVTYLPAMARSGNRYRPGRPWTYPPVWWVADADDGGRKALPAAPARTTTKGGARGTW